MGGGGSSAAPAAGGVAGGSVSGGVSGALGLNADPSLARRLGRREDPWTYALRGVYFKRDSYSSTADCLTAAYAQELPLDLCR